MLDNGHEDGGVRAFAETCFENGEIAEMFVVPGLSEVGDFQRVVCVFGNDFDIVTDAEIALECFYKADAAILELLVANHLDLECILDCFKNGCRGSRNDEIVVVDDGGENVG